MLTFINLRSTLTIFLGLRYVSFALGILTSDDCKNIDGSNATGYSPCFPNADQSNCCDSGEVCLQNGLCFGRVGLLYRGACAGGWGDNTTCPDYCSFISSGFANIWVCPGNGDSGATVFWCGDGTVCDTTQTEDVSFFGISNYKFQAETILGVTANPSIQTVTATTTASGTTVPTGTSNPAPANNTPTPEDGNCPANHDVAIGAGVGVPLGLLAITALAWAIWERRRRSRAGATTAPVSVSSVPSYIKEKPASGYSPHIPVSEMGVGGNQAAELEGR